MLTEKQDKAFLSFKVIYKEQAYDLNFSINNSIVESNPIIIDRVMEIIKYKIQEMIMLSSARVVHCKKEPYDVYIGRPGPWGNPFSHKYSNIPGTIMVPTKEEAIAKYREYILGNPDLLAKLVELKGKTLGCWCKPLSCHGDVLVQLIKERYGEI